MGNLDTPGKLWLYRTKPQEDELFSSWLVRLSWGNAVKLQTFTTQVLKLQPGFWTGDVDRKPNDSALKRVCEGAGVPEARALATGLANFEGRLWPEYHHRGLLPWATIIGRKGRRRYMHGQQFCPHCLREDEQPYFRRKWRLAFNVACEKHGIYLSDACPHCNAPVEFHTGDFGERLLPLECPITRCHSCKEDLRDSFPAKIYPVPDEFLNFHKQLNQCAHLGWRHNLPGAENYSHLFFSGFRHLVHFACSRSRFSRARSVYLRQNGMLDMEFSSENLRSIFESLRVNERVFALDIARQLLHDWPYMFIDLCKQSRVSSSYLVSYQNQQPYWLQSEIAWFLDDRDYAPSKEERKSAAAYLKKNNLHVCENSINRLLGVSSVTHQVRHPEKGWVRWNPRGAKRTEA